ncbi:MAG TPA: NADH-quinone oxidoreductase subunit M [Miltoncostaeaceae bacterium]|nr:NADH-quinone oxidoreductase subunit M [Miltoncostaeaceae bacterium]
MPWNTALILLPLVGALSMLIVPVGNVLQARVHALLFGAGTLALSIGMLTQFDRGLGTPQLVDRQGWASELGLEWSVWVDGISIWLVLLTTALFALGLVAACIVLPERPRAFLGLLLLAEAALLGLFVAGNLVLFYVFWEAMLIPFYFLIGLWGSEGRGRAVLKFVIYTMVGSLLMLVAILATAFIAQDVTGQFTFDIEALRGVAFSREESIWLFAGFALAFAIKLPLWPFHAWLPDTYRVTPIIVVALLAAVMSKAGVYGFLRVGTPLFPDGVEAFQYPLILLSLAGIVYGSLVAWRAPTMRLLIAYSSIAHLGFVMLGIIAIDPQAGQGAVLQMVNHGVIVAAAFVIVGIIAGRSRREGVDDLGGLAAGAPWLAGIFLVVTMASLAIPGSNAFVGEFFILSGTFRQHAWASVIACLGIVYAAVYMLRLYQRAMNGPLGPVPGSRVEMRTRDFVSLVPLVGAMAFIALWPQALVGATTASVERALAPAQIRLERPADQIRAEVVPNPPAAAQPLPGDPEPPLPSPEEVPTP